MSETDKAAASASAPSSAAPAVAAAGRGGLLDKIIRFFEDEEFEPAAPAAQEEKPPAQLRPAWYYWIFAASGFAGLIYESIWARYLKLLLGHAAYAQALVLAIFLLGLAVGAALCARVSHRLPRPLLYYAVIEILVALTAVYFHEIFVIAQSWAVDTALPQIESDTSAELFKWLLAAGLILPQSILLGATFPLMSAGLLRLWREQQGRIVAMLYFSNSLGAVFGVLASGFVLIPLAGLPGTIAIAGFISVAAAAAVWALGHLFDDTGEPLSAAAPAAAVAAPAAAAATTEPAPARLTALILTVAFGTGLASFVYEIIWVRMLALLLGSATRTFEIMLAAFILGLALGGFAVRRRVEGGGLLGFLGKVQIAMGVLALWSLFCFPLFYEVLREALPDIPRDDAGYLGYTALQLGLSLVMMLPATFCAGMTLPLLTRCLMDSGGEAAVGKVYAVNTLGAIVGVFIAMHLLLPQLGMQQGLIIAAMLDMLLGIALLTAAATAVGMRVAVAAGCSVAAVAVAAVFGSINLQIAAAGVFRHQIDILHEVVFYRDGKTASIAVTEENVPGNSHLARAIRTNGKSDAAVYVDGTPPDVYTGDAPTMVLLGLLPMLYNAEISQVMNIGFGSGMTSRTLLLSPHLERLDNVEIEAAVIEGARHMGERVSPVFDDPRNTFIINDAKTVMSRTDLRYDAIISEPSNPWVSGTANLFTKEFYERVRATLTEDGYFVQWLPLYEMDPLLFSSVVRALSEVFEDFHAYSSTESNIIFIASAGKMPPPSDAVFASADSAELRDFLNDYDYPSSDTVRTVFLGSKKTLLPYFESFNAPVNSDYFPYVENRAPRAFFNKTFYTFAGAMLTTPIPVMEFLGYPRAPASEMFRRHSQYIRQVSLAHQVHMSRLEEDGVMQLELADMATYTCPITSADAENAENAEGDEVQGEQGDQGDQGEQNTQDAQGEQSTQGEQGEQGAQDTQGDATGTDYLVKISEIVTKLMPVLDKSQMEDIWHILEQDACVNALLQDDESVASVYTQFWRAVSLRDAETMVQTAEALLPHADLNTQSGQVLLLGAMAGHYHVGNYQRVVLLMLDMPLVFPAIHHAARIISANAAQHI